MADSGWHPSADEMDLSKVLSALADPMRRGVVLDLARGDGAPRLCGTFAMPVTKATRTHHFRVLREAGLIRQVDLGNGRTNVLRRAELDARFPGLLAAILTAAPEPLTEDGPLAEEGPAAADQIEASISEGASTPAPAR